MKSDSDQLREFDAAFSQGVPHNHALGMSVVGYTADSATMLLPYREDLVGNPETGVIHGGVVTSLMDACCGAAVFVTLPRRCRIATLDLRIDYLKPATPGLDLICRAECYKVTRMVAFVRAVAHHGTPSDALASAAGTFMVFRGDRNSVVVQGSEGGSEA